MASKDLKDILKKLCEQGKTSFSEGATQEQILSFENKHKITLPEKLKEWFALSDGGEFFLPAGVQIYGVAHKPIIDVVDNDRPNNNFIVIGTLASGDPILFEKGKETIAIYNHEEDTIEEDEVYDDFYAFLNDLYNLLGIGG